MQPIKGGVLERLTLYKRRRFAKGALYRSVYLELFSGMRRTVDRCLRRMCRMFIGACQAFVKYAPDVRLTFDRLERRFLLSKNEA